MTKTVARGRCRQVSESLYYCLTAIIAYYVIGRDRIRTDEPAVNVVIHEEDGNVEQFELPLIGDAERDSGEFIIGERLTVQQRDSC